VGKGEPSFQISTDLDDVRTGCMKSKINFARFFKNFSLHFFPVFPIAISKLSTELLMGIEKHWCTCLVGRFLGFQNSSPVDI